MYYVLFVLLCVVVSHTGDTLCAENGNWESIKKSVHYTKCVCSLMLQSGSYFTIKCWCWFWNCINKNSSISSGDFVCECTTRVLCLSHTFLKLKTVWKVHRGLKSGWVCGCCYTDLQTTLLNLILRCWLLWGVTLSYK